MPELFGDTFGLPVTTRSGIPYEIDAFDYREVFRPGQNRTTVVCRVAYERSFDWVTEMVGRAYTSSSVGGVKLRRDLPQRNPFDSRQWCTGVEQVDQGGDPPAGSTFAPAGTPPGVLASLADPVVGWPVVKWKRYRATFEAMPYQMRTDAQVDQATTGPAELQRYVMRVQRSTPREQQIPGGGFETITDPPVKLMIAGFKTIAFADVTYTWCRVPVANFLANTAKDELLGKINDAIFDDGSAPGDTQKGGGYKWATGKLLYLGYDDSNRYYDANEDWVTDIVFSFKFKQIGWDFYLNNLGDPVEVQTLETVPPTPRRKPYQRGDFNQLFTVGAA